MRPKKTPLTGFDPSPPPRRPKTPAAAALPRPENPKADAVSSAADVRPWFDRTPVLLPIPFPRAHDACRALMQLNREAHDQPPEAAKARAAQADAILRELIDSGEPERARRLAENHLDTRLARQVLGQYGFIASCVTHHRQTAGLPTQLPDALVHPMLSLGARIGQTPRDTARTAWIDWPPYAWIGDRSEAAFGAQVRAIEMAFLNCAARLSPFLRGDVTFIDAQRDIAEAIGEVTHLPVFDDPGPATLLRGRFLTFIHPLVLDGRRYEGPHGTRTYGWELIRGIADHRIGPDGPRGLLNRVLRRILADYAGPFSGAAEMERTLAAMAELDRALWALEGFYAPPTSPTAGPDQGDV